MGLINEANNKPREFKPQVKWEMPDYYECNAAEINNWLWQMETYFIMVGIDANMPDCLVKTIIMVLQWIRKGKANCTGAWSVVKLREWIDTEKEYGLRQVDGTFLETQN